MKTRLALMLLALPLSLRALAAETTGAALERAARLYQARDFAGCAEPCSGRSGGSRPESGLLALLRGQCAFYAGRHQQALGCFRRAERGLTGSLRALARARRADTLWELGRRRRAVGLYWQAPRGSARLVDTAAGAWRVLQYAREQERPRPGGAGKG